MAKHNYLVSVFVDGRNVNSYFSENLDDLVTIKAIHKNCEITIFDLVDFVSLKKEQVDIEISKSGNRWKKSLGRTMEQPRPSISHVFPSETTKKKKNWKRSVMCVETEQVFPSIRDCCEKIGIPYMTIVNCIKNGNATRGVHFVNAPKR